MRCLSTRVSTFSWWVSLPSHTKFYERWAFWLAPGGHRPMGTASQEGALDGSGHRSFPQ